jgi:hypothetical protein
MPRLTKQGQSYKRVIGTNSTQEPITLGLVRYTTLSVYRLLKFRVGIDAIEGRRLSPDGPRRFERTTTS